jgi:hypothetical protein
MQALIAKDIKDINKMAAEKAMAHTITKMVLFMRVNGKVICQTVME